MLTASRLAIAMAILSLMPASVGVAAPAAGDDPGVPLVPLPTMLRPDSIPDSEYVVVRDGHLSLGGQPQRYWAIIGQVFSRSAVKPDDTPEQREEKVSRAHKGTDILVQRYIDLGFNATRLWAGFSGPSDYEPGDGSEFDDTDYFIARMKQRGLKIWLAGLNHVGGAQPEDVSIIDDPNTAEAWAAAVREATRPAEDRGRPARDEGWALRNNPARIWDSRLEALAIKRMQTVSTHLNKYTGLRWCDDPVFIVWELSNEEWWITRMMRGGWQQLPAFFKNQLVARWNEFLRTKYGTDEKLIVGWGALLPGENLASGTVLLAPVGGKSKTEASINDANPQARAALEGLKQEYAREDFAPQRAADVLEFLVELHVKHKEREAAAIKPLGRSTRLCAMVYDTGIGYEIQSQYLHQNADAVAHDAYVNGGGPTLEAALKQVEKQTSELQRVRVTIEAERISRNDGLWVNWLLKPPGISQGVPWLEHNRVEGKPYFCYETQIQQPAKYRADFPLRLAALASIQDWDFVCWHYFSPGTDVATNDRPFDKAMDVTTGSHPQGYHFTYDEVQNAMMRAAGLMWRNRLLEPAKIPTTFVYGRKSLYDPASMEYGGSYGFTGLDMMSTVYQYGCRIRIDPTREDDEVIGPVVKFSDRGTHNPYTPTKQITFDWQKGYLSFDAAGAAAFTGLLARVGETVRFATSDVLLSEVRISNPPGIYDPVRDDEKYVSFSLYATDGKSLAGCKTASLSLVSTSFNTGFKLRTEPEEKAAAGELPVLVVRVGGTVRSPHIAGMEYVMRDWHLRELKAGKINSDGVLMIPLDQPVFVVELTR